MYSFIGSYILSTYPLSHLFLVSLICSQCLLAPSVIRACLYSFSLSVIEHVGAPRRQVGTLSVPSSSLYEVLVWQSVYQHQCTLT